MRYTLGDASLAGLTGRGVRVAVVDSGIALNHPHVGAVGVGISFVGEDTDTNDRIGHGTAVAAAIREKAPEAELVPVRVFDRELATDAATLARAIVWAVEHDCKVINLSLGTTNEKHRALLEAAVDAAHAKQATVVAAFESDGVRWLPGSLARALGVVSAPDLDRNSIEFDIAVHKPPILARASIYPRPIPGVPKERNFHGVSFAVANVSGFQALLEERGYAAPDPGATY
jgi:subtilisin family serine protease